MKDKITRLLACRLSDAEWDEMATALATECKTLTALEEEKKAAMNDFKARIDSSKAIIELKAQIVESKHETRPVECQWIFHTPAFGMKQLRRMDTLEAIDERDMTYADKEEHQLSLQTRMPLEEPRELLVKMHENLAKEGLKMTVISMEQTA